MGVIESLRTAHNSFARPEPFVFDDKKEEGEEEDAFHFIGFVPVNGRLYELDGLKAGPILIDDCDHDNWLEKVKGAIEERMRKYSQKEIRFALLALIKNRQEVLSEELKSVLARKTLLEQKQIALAAPGPAAMDTSETEGDLKQMIEVLDLESKQIEEKIVHEQNKFKAWQVENVRRRHNYLPFIFNLVKTLAEKGKLGELVDKAAKVTAEKKERAKQNKSKTSSSKAPASTTATPATPSPNPTNPPSNNPPSNAPSQKKP